MSAAFLRFAIGLLLYLSIVSVFFEVNAFAETPTKAADCENKSKATGPKQPPSPGPNRQSNCCCPPVVNINQDTNVAKEDPSNEERWEKRASREVDQISSLANETLTAVRLHTDFLADLWKWTTIGGSIVVGMGSIIGGLLAVFGFKGVWDLYKFKQQTQKEFKEEREEMAKFRLEANANNIVLMFTSVAEDLTNAAAELEAEALVPGKEGYKTKALEKFRSVVGLFEEKIKKEKIENIVVDGPLGSYAYDLYAYALYKLGKISQALTAVKKSIVFRESPTALYNAACYAARLHLISLSAGYLQRAIELDDEYLTKWHTDPDFDEIRNLPEFRAIMGA